MSIASGPSPGPATPAPVSMNLCISCFLNTIMLFVQCQLLLNVDRIFGDQIEALFVSNDDMEAF